VESWQLSWRKGFVPQLSTEQLTALRDALATDDSRLSQGSTTTPPPLLCVQDWPVEAACLLGYCGVVAAGGFGTATVGQAEECFARLCFEADSALGEPAACRWVINLWDDTPRPEARRIFLEEVELALRGRGAELAAVAPAEAREMAPTCPF
jgi:hypothetical protein